jgi:hypothetical protein
MVYGFADQQEVIDEDLVDEMVQERMKDSIVPLATKSPPKGKKKKKKKSLYKKVEQVEDAPVEGDKAGVKVEDADNTGTTEPVEDKKNVYEENVEPIEQMVSESVVSDSSVKETIEKKEQKKDEDSNVKKRSPNIIEVLRSEEPSETKNWKWVAAAAVAIVVSVVIFMIGTSDPEEVVREKVASSDARVSQPAPVIQEVPDNIKRQLEEAERFRKELARRQEEDRARMEVLEKQAAVLQRERDEALAKVKAEKQKRTKESAMARAAAQNEKKAQEVAEKAIAGVLAAEMKNQLLIELRAEEAARLEEELQKQREILQAEKAATAKPEPEPVVEARKKEQSFNTDPCASSTARFLSTCR